jgi:predicted O-methyltransferase YrrM
MIFADTWAGKYTHLEQALQVLSAGGLYMIDDMLPQSNWPEGHDLKVTELLASLENRRNLQITKLSWASGVVIATKR